MTGDTSETATSQWPGSLSEWYGQLRKEDLHPIVAAFAAPVSMIGAAIFKDRVERHNRRQRRLKKRVKVEERWRQEAREEYGENTNQSSNVGEDKQ